jgi:hypothetical protein
MCSLRFTRIRPNRARKSRSPRVTVFDLDTLAPAGEIPDANAPGVAVSAKSGHAFASKPIIMSDAKTLAVIKKIDVDGGPDGIMYDAFNDRVWVFSHAMPHATVINAADGTIAGTIPDLGGPRSRPPATAKAISTSTSRTRTTLPSSTRKPSPNRAL